MRSLLFGLPQSEEYAHLLEYVWHAILGEPAVVPSLKPHSAKMPSDTAIIIRNPFIDLLLEEQRSAAVVLTPS
jgi:hypothetical protein